MAAGVAAASVLALAAACAGPRPDALEVRPIVGAPSAPRVSAGAATGEEPAAAPDDALREALRARLSLAEFPAASAVGGECLHAPAVVARFYDARAYAPAWVTSDGARPAAGQLLAAAGGSYGEGLRPADYHLAALVRLAGAAGPAAGATLLADLDLLATDAFVTLAGHLLAGRVDPVTAKPSWHADGGTGVTGALERAVDTGDPIAALDALRPTEPGYAGLREELHRLLALSSIAESDADLGPDARAALDRRIHTVEVNLERWRWLPASLGARHILVNVPAFRAELVENGVATLVMRAVVGAPYRRTPVFTGRATHVVLSPYWNVPPGIARKDVLPAVKKDSGYLARMHMHVLSGFGAASREVDPGTIDWAAMTGAAFNARYWFRADPGPNNPLGGVKIVFPNPYNVYLHGTSAPALLERPARAFSSGCIRVEHSEELATRLLAAGGWTDASVRAAIAAGKERAVPIPEPLPVHVLYWTVWVDATGALHYEDDVYGRDGALDTALRAPLPRGTCHAPPRSSPGPEPPEGT